MSSGSCSFPSFCKSKLTPKGISFFPVMDRYNDSSVLFAVYPLSIAYHEILEEIWKIICSSESKSISTYSHIVRIPDNRDRPSRDYKRSYALDPILVHETYLHSSELYVNFNTDILQFWVQFFHFLRRSEFNWDLVVYFKNWSFGYFAHHFACSTLHPFPSPSNI